MSRNQKLCGCGRSHVYAGQDQCTACDADDYNNRYDVKSLNSVETLEELKDWIKEHVIK